MISNLISQTLTKTLFRQSVFSVFARIDESVLSTKITSRVIYDRLIMQDKFYLKNIYLHIRHWMLILVNRRRKVYNSNSLTLFLGVYSKYSLKTEWGIEHLNDLPDLKSSGHLHWKVEIKPKQNHLVFNSYCFWRWIIKLNSLFSYASIRKAI